MDDKSIKRWRNFTSVSFLKIIAALGLIFGLIRIAIPDLVNAHDDFLGFAAIICMVAIPIIAGWLGVSIFLGIRRFQTNEENQ